MTAQRPTEESNAQSLLLFWSLAGPYQGVISIWKEVKDRHARTLNAVFLDIKTHYIYKPTETFQYTDTLPRPALRL